MRVFIIFCLFFSFTFGWGTEGHSIVAYIGERLLNDVSKANVYKLLEYLDKQNEIDAFPFYYTSQNRNGVSKLSDISSFADIYKRKSIKEITEEYGAIDTKNLLFTSPIGKSYSLFNSTYSLHFQANIEDACNSEFQSICENNKNLPATFPCVPNCITKAIIYYQNILKTTKDRYTASLALIFLVHLVGDIHQPFHCGFADDKGGNKAWAYFPSHEQCYKLHYMWDTIFIQKHLETRNSWLDLAKELTNKAKLHYEIHLHDVESVSEWWEQSHSFLKEKWIGDSSFPHTGIPYSLLSRDTLICSELPFKKQLDYGVVTSEYEEYANTVIFKQLANAGARLAALLNTILDKSWNYPVLEGISPLRVLVQPKNLYNRPRDEL